MGSAVSMRDVRHRLGGREVLSVRRLDVAAGARVAVLGPNGAGKSTLLRLVAGLDAPALGHVLVDGVEAARRPLADRRRAAYVTQRPGLVSETVLRNVELPLRWRGVPRARRHEAARAALDRMGLLHLAGRQATALSGGERQRVSLARALALEPGLLLLDEPAAGLDVPTRAAFLADLERAVPGDSTCTLVHVTHRPAEAFRMADTVAVLVAGEVRQVAAPADLLRSPADDVVARLVGYETLLPAVRDGDGRVGVEGHVVLSPTATEPGRPGPVVAACFAAGVRIGPPHGPGLPATVESASVGPGHGVVRLSAGRGCYPVTAHPGPGERLPGPGDRVRLTLDAARTVVVDRRGHQPPDSPPADSTGPRVTRLAPSRRTAGHGQLGRH